MKKINPVVKVIEYNQSGLAELDAIHDEYDRELFLEYPTVYVIGATKKQHTRLVYIGESSDIVNRTTQHLTEDARKFNVWQEINRGKNKQLIVIGHEHFNKSMTLDIENQLILYLSGADTNYQLVNGRLNPQGKYYPMEEKTAIFSRIWQKLHNIDPNIFPVEKVIRDSALFKASPFHTLTPEQLSAKSLVMAKVLAALREQQKGQVVVVAGAAGSGKTVLLSTLFYELMTTVNEDGSINHEDFPTNPLNARLMVNHDQQLKVYQQIMAKLGLYTKKGDQVGKPTHFINEAQKQSALIDVALVDEAHLLYSQGKQSYKGKNQLDDLRKIARVVIIVLDPHQVLATNEYRTKQEFNKLLETAKTQRNLVNLEVQMRMNADPHTLKWISNFIFESRIDPFPHFDAKGFELKVFGSPAEMEVAIREKAIDEAHGLSRLLATFDWQYINAKHPDDDPNKLWRVKIGEWSRPWNLQLPAPNAAQAKLNKTLTWAEQPQTIDEVGSTFTIQGLDLNYAAVILGPSVGYRNGRVVAIPSRSANKNATNKRTLDGVKIDVAAELLRNEMNVLMTRGVNGLYIYAVDPELRKALIAAQSRQQELPHVAEDKR